MKSQARKQIHIRNGITYSVNILQELSGSIPVEEVPIESLKFDKNEPLWRNDATENGKKYSMAEVMAGKQGSQFIAEHYGRALASDLSYPILTDSNYEPVDGYHRILRALIENLDTVKVRRFDSLPSEAIVE